MLRYDEASLCGRLAGLGERQRIIFALAVAARQLKNYERFATYHGACSLTAPRMLAEALLKNIEFLPESREEWQVRVGELLNLLLEDDHNWVLLALADDAVSSLAYAIRCYISRSPQDGTWAARHAYEAADQAALVALRDQWGSEPDEATVLEHEWVQRELERQLEDLEQLRSGRDQEVLYQAFADDMLTDDEAACLGRLASGR